MALVKCKECDHEISKNAKSCLNCGAKPKKLSLPLIFVLFILGVIALGKFTEPPETSQNVQTQSQPEQKKINPQNTPYTQLLEVASWSCYEDHGYMIIEGEVKNIADTPLKNLRVVGNFRKDDGSFVKSDDGLIEYSPLLPNQTSPFKIMSRRNPAISKCKISFTTRSGQRIYHKDLKNEKKRENN